VPICNAQWNSGEDVGIKQVLTHFLMNRLPVDEQAGIAADVIAWRFADLPPAEQQKSVEQFAPGLMQMMREGRVGLSLLIVHHLLRLPPFHWLAGRIVAAPRAWREMPAAKDP
jgi:hypothetical protein